jgi:hypothetical protein
MVRYVHILRTRSWLAAGVGIGILCLLLVVAVLWPRTSRLIESATLLKEARTAIAEATGASDRWSSIDARHKRLTAEMASLVQRQDCGDCNSHFLELVRELADRSGVELLQIRPLDASEDETSRTLPVELVITARFHDLGLFVDAMERSHDVLNVRRIEARGGPVLEVSAVVEFVSLSESGEP